MPLTSPHPVAGPGHPVTVEVVLLRCATVTTAVRYRLVERPLHPDERPDSAAAALCRTEGRHGTTPAVLHSTSWRHDPQRGLVLTYAALPDPCPDRPAAVLHDPRIVATGDPLRPGPDRLQPCDIAAHAVRHLAYLLDRDPAIAATARRPDLVPLWAAVRATATTIDAHADVTVRPPAA